MWVMGVAIRYSLPPQMREFRFALRARYLRLRDAESGHRGGSCAPWDDLIAADPSVHDIVPMWDADAHRHRQNGAGQGIEGKKKLLEQFTAPPQAKPVRVLPV